MPAWYRQHYTRFVQEDRLQPTSFVSTLMARQQREPRSTRREDALSLLRRDHEQTQSLYEGFQTAGGDDRYFLASRIVRALEQHANIEEEVFYPVILALASKRGHRRGEELVRRSMKDHQTVRKHMTKMRDTLEHEEGYQIQLDELMKLVCQHAVEEEKELFAVARSLLNDAELMEIGDDIRRMKPEDDTTLAA
jgi:hemerythrin superfamily protein